MKIKVDEECELTDKFFDKYTIDDVLMFSYAQPGACGNPGNTELIVKHRDDEIALYAGTYMWENKKLTENKVMKFIDPEPKTRSEDWLFMYLGLGNHLFIRKEYAPMFIKKYKHEKNRSIIYNSWKYYADYVLDLYFNNNDDRKFLKEINRYIRDLRNWKMEIIEKGDKDV